MMNSPDYTVVVYYRKNLKMSLGKTAAQVAHAVNGLNINSNNIIIRVLMASDKRFNEIILENPNGYLHSDWGLTELDRFTETCYAYIQYEKLND